MFRIRRRAFVGIEIERPSKRWVVLRSSSVSWFEWDLRFYLRNGLSNSLPSVLGSDFCIVLTGVKMDYFISYLDSDFDDAKFIF